MKSVQNFPTTLKIKKLTSTDVFLSKLCTLKQQKNRQFKPIFYKQSRISHAYYTQPKVLKKPNKAHVEQNCETKNLFLLLITFSSNTFTTDLQF